MCRCPCVGLYQGVLRLQCQLDSAQASRRPQSAELLPIDNKWMDKLDAALVRGLRDRDR